MARKYFETNGMRGEATKRIAPFCSIAEAMGSRAQLFLVGRVLSVIYLSKLLKINSVPDGLAWYNEVKATEEQVLSKRN